MLGQECDGAIGRIEPGLIKGIGIMFGFDGNLVTERHRPMVLNL